ncbi:MAG: hypothetical protein ABEI52_10750, partial [Halobacteriaceae archaeon]
MRQIFDNNEWRILVDEDQDGNWEYERTLSVSTTDAGSIRFDDVDNDIYIGDVTYYDKATSQNGAYIPGRLGVKELEIAGSADIAGTIGLDQGTSVNEFSTDEQLSDNSDDALPTEQAVKQYVDSQSSSATQTLAEVLDTGNSADDANIDMSYNDIKNIGDSTDSNYGSLTNVGGNGGGLRVTSENDLHLDAAGEIDIGYSRDTNIQMRGSSNMEMGGNNITGFGTTGRIKMGNQPDSTYIYAKDDAGADLLQISGDKQIQFYAGGTQHMEINRGSNQVDILNGNLDMNDNDVTNVDQVFGQGSNDVIFEDRPRSDDRLWVN